LCGSEAINTLKNKKSTGQDGISSITIKNNKKFLAKILQPLFNRSLQTGVFPDVFKHAIITPIYKGGENVEVKNYRPIHVISSLSKVSEKCVKEKIVNFLEHKQFFSIQQFGSLKEKSTDKALFQHIHHRTDREEELCCWSVP